MKSRKQRYIDHIRTNTAYPTYRAFVWILTILGYVIAGLTLAVGLIILVDLFGIMAFWALRGWPARGIYFVASVVATIIIIFASQLFRRSPSFLRTSQIPLQMQIQFIWRVRKPNDWHIGSPAYCELTKRCARVNLDALRRVGMIHARRHGISVFFIGIISGSVSELINARGSGRKRHFGKILKTSNCEKGMSMKKIYCTT